MSWLRLAGDKEKKDRKVKFTGGLEKSKTPPREYNYPALTAPKYDTQSADYVPENPNVRDIYRLTDSGFKKWEKENPGKSHFLMTHFVDNIYKVHRPGKLTYRKANVPPQEISEWCRQAQSQGVTHAFVLLPDRDLDDYYAMYNGKQKIKSGKELLFEIYDAYGIKAHHYPITDFGTPTMTETVVAVDDLKNCNDEAEKTGGKIVVHCSAGIGRTGLLTSCYLVYTNKLKTNDIRQIIDNSGQSGLYNKNKSLSSTSLTDMQKKVWYDTVSQLEFIKGFSKIKDYFESQGKSIADEDSILQIKELDEKNARTEKERLEKEKKEIEKKWKDIPKQKFVSPEGGIDSYWKKKYGDELTDEDIDDLLFYKQQLKNKNKHNELTEQEQLEQEMAEEDAQRQLNFDVPPFDEYLEEDPTKIREELEKQELKRRNGKRNYLGKIETTCMGCGTELLFPVQFAGDWGTCPTCNSAVEIPKMENEAEKPVENKIPDAPKTDDMERVSPSTGSMLFKDDIAAKCPNCKKKVYVYNNDIYDRKIKCIFCRNIFNLGQSLNKTVPKTEPTNIPKEPDLKLSPAGDRAYYKKIKEIQYEPMEDEEWLKRFGSYFDGNIKNSQYGFEKFDFDEYQKEREKYIYKYPNSSTPYVAPPAITPVGEGIYKGKRPGHPLRKKIEEDVISKYAKEMLKEGITDVFVLLSEKEQNTYYDNNLEKVYSNEGLKVHNYPIEDFGVPSLEYMIEIVSDLYNAVNSGGKVLVHCSAGIGRTGTVLAAYFIWIGQKTNITVQSPAQRDFLDKWEKMVNGKKFDNIDTIKENIPEKDEKYKDTGYIDWHSEI